jgi:2-C-methyl-D-erythritol 4-phosphate cytidylyltransferase
MGGIPKILVPVNGLPLIGHTLCALEACALIDEIVVAAREEDVATIADLCHGMGLLKVSRILRGGDSRPLSVMIALMETKAGIVAIHDGARPCVTPALCSATIEKAIQTGAALPALPLSDSVKLADGTIIKTSADRSSLYTVQTPQCFEAGLIKGALAKVLQAGLDITDDSAAVEALPYPVHIVPGEARNIKVTTADDLLIASALLKGGAL